MSIQQIGRAVVLSGKALIMSTPLPLRSPSGYPAIWVEFLEIVLDGFLQIFQWIWDRQFGPSRSYAFNSQPSPPFQHFNSFPLEKNSLLINPHLAKRRKLRLDWMMISLVFGATPLFTKSQTPPQISLLTLFLSQPCTFSASVFPIARCPKLPN